MSILRQHTKTIGRRKFPSVIRCLDVGNNIGKRGIRNIIAVGVQDKHLYIMSRPVKGSFRLFQKLEFTDWVRCVKCADLDGDGTTEIIVGGGDCHLRVFSYNTETFKYSETCSIKFDNFVSCIDIGDVNNDGTTDIIVGSWDNTFKVCTYENQSLDLQYELKYDERVEFCKIGDSTWDGKKNIVLLLNKGTVINLEGDSGKELWRYVNPNEKTYHSCDIAVIDSSGYPFVVVGGSDKELLFFDRFGKVAHVIVMEDRIISLMVDCIDGDEIPEILLGLANKTLKIYEISRGGEDSLKTLEMKWQLKTQGVVTSVVTHSEGMCSFKNSEDVDAVVEHKKCVLFGGYDQILTAVEDFNYGEKNDIAIDSPPCTGSDLEIEVVVEEEPKTEVIEDESEAGEEESEIEDGEEESEIELIEDDVEISSVMDEELVNQIRAIFEETPLISTKGLFQNALKPIADKIGWTTNALFDFSHDNNIHKYNRSTPRGYILNPDFKQ